MAMCTKGSGHELGEAARLALQVPGAHHVAGPADRAARRTPNMMVTFERRPDRVGGAVGLEPLLGVDLVGAEQRRGPRRRGSRPPCPGRVLSPASFRRRQVLGQGHLGAAGPLGHLQRGEAVDVDVGPTPARTASITSR